MWIQLTKDIELVKPQIVYVVNTFKSIICIVLLLGKEQIWIESKPINIA